MAEDLTREQRIAFVATLRRVRRMFDEQPENCHGIEPGDIEEIDAMIGLHQAYLDFTVDEA